MYVMLPEDSIITCTRQYYITSRVNYLLLITFITKTAEEEMSTCTV